MVSIFSELQKPKLGLTFATVKKPALYGSCCPASVSYLLYFSALAFPSAYPQEAFCLAILAVGKRRRADPPPSWHHYAAIFTLSLASRLRIASVLPQ